MFDKKFANVNVLETLYAIMMKNTSQYRSDFQYDKDLIEEVAGSEALEDKVLLWISYPCGTRSFREKDVFLKENPSHSVWTCYGAHDSEGILAFVVEITGKHDGNIIGNIYPVDFTEHWQFVQRKAVPVEAVELEYADKTVRLPYDEYSRHRLTIFAPNHEVKKIRYIPKEEDSLNALLQSFRSERDKAKEYDVAKYIASLGGIARAISYE